MTPVATPRNDEEGWQTCATIVRFSVGEGGRFFLDASRELAEESDRDTHRRPKLCPHQVWENA